MDLYEIRAGLGRTAGRLPAPRLTTDEKHLLGVLLDQMDATLADRGSGTYQTLNTEFQRQLMAATRNPG